MSEPSITVRTPAKLGYVESLLAANDLPTADLRTDPVQCFVGTVGGNRVGVGGLELYGTVGLLRSVVIAESSRGQGYGTALCDELETVAGNAEIEQLYLLTTSATAFFEHRGYRTCSRDAVPEEIRTTAEFSKLCPATATCLQKPL